MKTWLLVLLLSLSLPGWRWLTRVRDYNAAQLRGQAAAARGQATEAAYYFGQAVTLAGRGAPAPTLLLGLAQAQAQAGQLAHARATYARLLAPAVPAGVGSTARQQLAVLLARQGQAAQAVVLLRQALRLNPENLAARYNYEVLSHYLAHQRPAEPDNPPLPPPAQAPPKPRAGQRPDSTAGGGASQAPHPGSTGQPGASPNATSPQPAASGQNSPSPSSAGQANNQLPSPNAGSTANGGFRPGAGAERPLPSGQAGGRQRGLDLGAAAGQPAPNGRSQRLSAEAATDADSQLQTQRERLKAMSLTPAQAQQLLEELRASEQQYLQQRPRPQQGQAPAPGTPTW